MTILELHTFPASEAYLADPKEALSGLGNKLSSTGITNVFHGLPKGKNGLVYLVAFSSSTETSTLPAYLDTASTGAKTVEHADFTDYPIEKVFTAPATEIAFMDLKPEFADRMPELLERHTKFITDLSKAKGFIATGRGVSVEKPNRLFVMLGWEKIESFQAATLEESFKQNIPLLKEFCDIELTFTENFNRITI